MTTAAATPYLGDMVEALVAVAVVVSLFISAIVWRLGKARRERTFQRGDTARAGRAAEIDGDEAARRALDRTAWSRMYGP